MGVKIVPKNGNKDQKIKHFEKIKKGRENRCFKGLYYHAQGIVLLHGSTTGSNR